MKVLALIPARGGSQRVPGKNILTLGGKPLINYTIEAARHSRLIDRIIVSTDSEAIGKVALESGADVPFMRPAEIANSNSTEMQFLNHAIDWLEKNEGYECDLIVLLYPTSPFRKTQSIDSAIDKIICHPEADSLRSVRLCSEHPYKMWDMEDGYLNPFVKTTDANMHTWSYQMLPTVYIQNASIYITKPATIREKGTPTGDIIIPFVMDELESIDINTPLDFSYAEFLINKVKNDHCKA